MISPARRHFGRPCHVMAIVPLLALAWLVTAAGPARGDNIDEELKHKTHDVMKFLKGLRTTHVKDITGEDEKRKHKYHVGVLNFFLKLDGRYDEDAQIGGNMALRLENALIWSMDPEVPVQPVINARQTAAAKVPQGCRTEESRKVLLDLEFPTQDQPVKVDAFLTGFVVVNDGFRSATVHITAFDGRTPGYMDVLSFDVPMDRYLLAETGQGFTSTRRGRGDLVEDDEGAVAVIEPKSAEKSETVELKITYNGEPQDLQAGDRNWRLDEPARNAEVVFHVKNLTRQKLGIVLLVNGVNTLFEEEERAVTDMSFWVLEPGIDYAIEGFYKEDMTQYTPFGVMSQVASKDHLELAAGDKAGFVNLHVFTPKSDTSSNKPNGTSFLSRGGVPSQARGIIGHADQNKNQSLEEATFDPGCNSDTMVIKYYNQN